MQKKTLLISVFCVFTLSQKLPAVPFNWTNAAGGEWFTSTNWDTMSVPNAVDDIVVFPTLGAATKSITLMSPAILGSLTFNTNSTSDIYTIGSGELDFSVSSGGPSISSGGAAHTISANLVIYNSPLSVTVSDNSLNVQGNITGSGAKLIVNSGSGSLVLSGAGNTYDGGTDINTGGTLKLSGAGRLTEQGDLLVNGTFDMSGMSGAQIAGALSGSGHILIGSKILAVGYGNGSSTFAGILEDDLSQTTHFSKSGTGTLTLTGQNALSRIAIPQGTLALSGNGTFGNSLQITEISPGSGAILDISEANNSPVVVGNLFSSGNVSVILGANSIETKTNGSLGFTTFTGVIQGSGGVICTNVAGTTAQTFTAVQNYTGPTTINTGTLALSGSGSIASSSGVTVEGTFNITGITTSTQIQALSGTNPNGTVSLGAKTLIVNQSTDTTFNGRITSAGAGVLTKTNTGTLNLTGTSFYTGGTNFNGGTVSIVRASSLGTTGPLSFNSGTLRLTGNVALSPSATTLNAGGGTIDTNGNTLTLNNAIGGGGSLTKIGANTLTLTGTSTYTGGTNINGGTISIARGNNLGGTGPLTFNSGALLLTSSTTLSPSSITLNAEGGTIDTNGNTLTLSNAIGGVGSLTKAGSNTLILDGTNNYSGGTTVSGGTLQGTTSSLQGNIVNNGNVTFNQTTSGTYAGQISETGSLTKTNSGTVTLSGTNSYTGGTNINGGAISIGAANNLGDSGPLVFDTGTLIITNTLTLTPSSITLNAGGGTIDTNGNTLTLSNAIGGVGSLTKAGSNTLILDGTNNYSGATTVSGGILSVNGVIDSSVGGVTVESLGTLKGTGTIQGSVTTEGTLSPGNSIGTLTIDNDLIFEPGSLLQIEVDFTGAASKLIVSGTTTIPTGQTATLEVIDPTPGLYTAGTRWEILESTGGFTTADTFNYTAPSFLPSLTVDYSVPHFIYLTIAETTLVGLQTEGLSGNNLTLANYLNASITNLAILDIIDDLFPYSGETLNNYLTALSPLRLTSQSFASINTQFSFSDLLFTHCQERRKVHHSIYREPTTLASQWESQALLVNADESFLPSGKNEEKASSQTCKKRKNTACLWVNGFGQFTHEKSRDSNPSFDNTTGGALLGLDFIRSDLALFGGSLAYAHNRLKEEKDLGNASSNIYSGALYLTIFQEKFYISGALWGGYNQISNKRNVIIPNTSTSFNSTSHVRSLTPHLDLGIDFQRKWLTIEPFTAFDWSCNWESKIDEEEDLSLNMTVNARHYSLLRSEVGLSFFEEIEMKEGLFFARQTLSYINKKPFSVGYITASMGGQPTTFTMETFTNTQDLFAPGVEFFWKKKSGLSLSLMYGGEFGSGYISNQIVGKAGWQF